MTTLVSAPACSHDARGVCFLCSDQVAWWKAARIKAGYGEEPPNKTARALALYLLNARQNEADNYWKFPNEHSYHAR